MYELIKKIAYRKGVSIYKIEKECGLSNGAISKWEKSKPNSEPLSKVAQYLGVTVDDLLKSDEKKVAN